MLLNKKIQQYFTLILAMIALVGVHFQANADSSNPYVLMQETSDKLFNSIKADQAKIKQNPNYLRTLVKENLMPYVHVKYAGSLTLGTYFKSTTPEQQERFFQAFADFIEQSYAQILTLYDGQKFEIEPEKDVSKANIVNIRVTIIQNNGKPPIKLDFKWRKNSKTGEWQAYDMAAEGISMIVTKQNEWSGILRKQGIDALTQQIQKASQEPIVFNKK